MADRETELQEELKEAAERASRANERARQAEEAYRKVQMDLVTAKDETESMRAELQTLGKRILVLEAERDAAPKPASRPPTKAPSKSPPADRTTELTAEVEMMLTRIVDLRDMLSAAAVELSDLHADEVALAAKRTRVLSDACTLLAKAVGETGQAPPPIPNVASSALEASHSVKPVMDISEVAELIESLPPPKSPTIE